MPHTAWHGMAIWVLLAVALSHIRLVVGGPMAYCSCVVANWVHKAVPSRLCALLRQYRPSRANSHDVHIPATAECTAPPSPACLMDGTFQ